MKPPSKNQIEERGIEIDAIDFAAQADGEPIEEFVPFGFCIVFEQAFDAVTCVGRPVEEADSRLGQESLDFMIFDEDDSFGHTYRFGQEPVGTRFVVQHVCQDDEVHSVVPVRESAPVIGLHLDGLAPASAGLETDDANTGGTAPGVKNGSAEGARATTDVKNEIIGLDVGENRVGQDRNSSPVNWRMEPPHEAGPGIFRFSVSHGSGRMKNKANQFCKTCRAWDALELR